MPGPWRLVYSGVDATFSDASGIYLRSAPEIADYDIAVDDTDNARTDGSQFGQDFHGGRTIGLSFGIIGSSEAEMGDRAAQLASYWDAAVLRAKPGAIAELISDRGRSAFGRPRSISPSEVHPEARMMTVEASFRQADKLWYGTRRSLSVSLGLTQGGGFKFPLQFPIVFRGYTSAANTFVVEGEAATWPVVSIRGPIVNPVVEVAGQFKFAATTSLKYDETLTIDTRPGRQTVLRSGNRIASLTRSSSLLEEAALPPGSYTFTLSGSSTSGAPNAQISWRSAYSTP